MLQEAIQNADSFQELLSSCYTLNFIHAKHHVTTSCQSRFKNDTIKTSTRALERLRSSTEEAIGCMCQPCCIYLKKASLVCLLTFVSDWLVSLLVAHLVRLHKKMCELESLVKFHGIKENLSYNKTDLHRKNVRISHTPGRAR